ncbi:hypothetical protein HK102_007120 [Quaeritorhiza haematococci]|nr:hypothetical protein HK102_007120 [Quaeritorhiza haematococci]
MLTAEQSIPEGLPDRKVSFNCSGLSVKESPQERYTKGAQGNHVPSRDGRVVLREISIFTSLERVAELIEERGFRRPRAFPIATPDAYGRPQYLYMTTSFDGATLVVTDGPSTYDYFSPKINRDQPLHEYYHEWLKIHRYGQRDTKDTEADVKPQTVELSRDAKKVNRDLSISFHRTLRVPEDGETYPLPACLGHFPLFDVSQYRQKINDDRIAKRGGVFFPVYQREAMWISFASRDFLPYAIKLSGGGVNGITGLPNHVDLTGPDARKGHEEIEQDYLVVPTQPWIDGVRMDDKTVRQFVAMPLDSGYTIEDQLTGKGSVGGLQLDIFEGYESNVSFYVGSCKNRNKKELACGPTASFYKSPSQLGLSVGEKIVMKSKYKIQRPTFLWDLAKWVGGVGETANDTLTGTDMWTCEGACDPLIRCSVALNGMGIFVITDFIKTSFYVISETTTAPELMQAIEDREGLPHPFQRLLFNGWNISWFIPLKEIGVSNGSVLDLVLEQAGGGPGTPPSMGIGAGGKIQQKIYKDSLGGPNGEGWKREPCARIHVHMLNSTEFEKVTGILPPETPISERDYSKQGIPWFQSKALNTGNVGKICHLCRSNITRIVGFSAPVVLPDDEEEAPREQLSAEPVTKRRKINPNPVILLKDPLLTRDGARGVHDASLAPPILNQHEDQVSPLFKKMEIVEN